MLSNTPVEMALDTFWRSLEDPVTEAIIQIVGYGGVLIAFGDEAPALPIGHLITGNEPRHLRLTQVQTVWLRAKNQNAKVIVSLLSDKEGSSGSGGTFPELPVITPTTGSTYAGVGPGVLILDLPDLADGESRNFVNETSNSADPRFEIDIAGDLISTTYSLEPQTVRGRVRQVSGTRGRYTTVEILVKPAILYAGQPVTFNNEYITYGV